MPGFEHQRIGTCKSPPGHAAKISPWRPWCGRRTGGKTHLPRPASGHPLLLRWLLTRWTTTSSLPDAH
eukprot:scaffold7253_cov385-Prasinococcus_capsulatus_cf.AAC.11